MASDAEHFLMCMLAMPMSASVRFLITFCWNWKFSEELRSVTRLSVDMLKELYPTWALTLKLSEILIKNLSKLTFNSSFKLLSSLPKYPPHSKTEKRNHRGLYGVRTSLTAWKKRMKKMIRFLKYQHCWGAWVESSEERFRCSCHYYLYYRDLSEDTKHGEYL
ncbi:unnamed protein product [Nyctereutes procyonoides]|uniref:(raccoon dog) hypothetical protein n=1 Tax=Nyctereutes procyonoides TaxID=34880 RepID=A0A811YIA2_NYCPR|nr:unnamed protein product [Nyctereutes procyonoides]